MCKKNFTTSEYNLEPHHYISSFVYDKNNFCQSLRIITQNEPFLPTVHWVAECEEVYSTEILLNTEQGGKLDWNWLAFYLKFYGEEEQDYMRNFSAELQTTK